MVAQSQDLLDENILVDSLVVVWVESSFSAVIATGDFHFCGLEEWRWGLGDDREESRVGPTGGTVLIRKGGRVSYLTVSFRATVCQTLILYSLIHTMSCLTFESERIHHAQMCEMMEEHSDMTGKRIQVAVQMPVMDPLMSNTDPWNPWNLREEHLSRCWDKPLGLHRKLI
jgi:hypothetical protein